MRRYMRLILMTILVMAAFDSAQAQTATPNPPPFSITIDKVMPPQNCTSILWQIPFDSTVTGFYDYDRFDTIGYYIIQYVDGSPVYGRWFGREYDRRLVTQYLLQMEEFRLAFGNYLPRYWTDSYQATTEMYVAFGDDVVWKISGAITCDQGQVTDYAVTSEPLTATRADVPTFEHNLVLALDDIPLYEQYEGKHRNNYLGTIQACQTFFVGDYHSQHPDTLFLAPKSLTDHEVLLFDGYGLTPIVDVAEDYGQPGGQPVLDECAAVTPEAP